MARPEQGPSNDLVGQITKFAGNPEIVRLPDGNQVYSFYNQGGIEMRPFLDPDHLPALTEFTSVALYPSLANARGQAPDKDLAHAREIKGADPAWLRTISEVALKGEGYKDTSYGKAERNRYARAMVDAMKFLRARVKLTPDTIFVPVRRAGENIAKQIQTRHRSIPIDAKRLRLKGLPNLLAGGVTLPPEAHLLHQKPIRLVEGVVASGSTEATALLAMFQEGIIPSRIDTDAVVLCPVGATFTDTLKASLEIEGADYGTYVGGTLSSEWYVLYHPTDPLLMHLGPRAPHYLGKQVMGDGGDLTTNL